MAANSFHQFVDKNKTQITWLGCCLVFFSLMWMLISQHEHHYLTQDSYYYFEVSDNILAGKSWVLKSLRNDEGQKFSPFPPLYPLAISLLRMFGLSALLASKLLNAILVSLLLGMASNQFRAWPVFAVWPFFTDHFLFVFCHSWSEPLFVACLFAWVWQVERWQNGNQIAFWWSMLWLTAACFTRYIGAFAILYAAVSGLFQLRSGRYHLGFQWLAMAVCSAFLLGAYLIADYFQSGMLTGGPRYAHSEPFSQIVMDWLQAMINELLIFRNLFPNIASPIAWAGIAFQSFIIWTIYKKLAFNWEAFVNPFVKISFFYLAVITVVRGYFYFAEPFDTRLLFPFAALFWWGINEGLVKGALRVGLTKSKFFQ